MKMLQILKKNSSKSEGSLELFAAMPFSQGFGMVQDASF